MPSPDPHRPAVVFRNLICPPQAAEAVWRKEKPRRFSLWKRQWNRAYKAGAKPWRSMPYSGAGQPISLLHAPWRDLTAGLRRHRCSTVRAGLTGHPVLAAILALNCFGDLPNFSRCPTASYFRQHISLYHQCNKLYAIVQNAVCGNQEMWHEIVLTANYIAKP